MNRLLWALAVIAVLVAIIGAFVTRFRSQPTYREQPPQKVLPTHPIEQEK